MKLTVDFWLDSLPEYENNYEWLRDCLHSFLEDSLSTVDTICDCEAMPIIEDFEVRPSYNVEAIVFSGGENPPDDVEEDEPEDRLYDDQA